MFDKEPDNLQSQDLMFTRRLRYLKLVYILSVILIPFYFFKYNFQYHVSEYNTYLGLLFVGNAFAPWVYSKTKNYVLCASIVYGFAGLSLILLLYTAGGILAPGVFWLSAIFVTGSILFGRRGTFIGAGWTLLTLCFFYVSHEMGTAPPVVYSPTGYDTERFTNLATFFIYCILTTAYFINAEERAHQQLQENKIEIENLLRILIHDIANPVTVLRSCLEKIQEEVREPDLAKYIFRSERATSSIISILHQVRQMKALQDGKLTVLLKPVNLCKSLRRVIDLMVPHFEEKSLKLNLQIPHFDIFISGDEAILESVVLSNILSNAIKFSVPGSAIDVRISPTQGMVAVEIQDYGIGIPKKILDQIFSLNYQTTRAGTKGEKGTGYGMPLVLEYIARMKGTINIISSEEVLADRPRGTSVILNFPSL